MAHAQLEKLMILHKNSPKHELEKYAGGKASNMAELEKAKVPVPPWFCVASPNFNHFISQFKDQDLWSLSHDEIEKKFLNGQLDPKLVAAIEAELKTMPSESTFAVRSSGIGEDSIEHSFAGQFSSYLHQKNLEDILKSTKLCWASAFTERARTYRQERKVSTTAFSMGVVIQRMIHADIAGVGFSRDPIHPLKRDQMIISSVYGLGEGLVSGELDADHFYVDRTNGRIEPHIVRKDHYFVRNPAGGILKKEVPSDKKDLPSLTDSQIEVIKKAMIRLETHQGSPQDIEWVFENGDFYCVQTRPITSLPPEAYFKASVKGARFVLWDNSNITESYNGITSPLTFSHISRAYRQVYIQFCEVMGVPPELIREHEGTFRNMLGLIRGRVYYNLGNWYQMIFLFPFSAKSNSFMETMMGVKQGLRPELAALFDFTKNPPKYFGPRKIYILGLNLWRIFKVRSIIDTFKQDFDRAYTRAKTQDYSQKSIEELIDAYDQLSKDLLFKWKAPIISDTRCMIFFGLLKSLTDKWIQNKHTSLYNDLLSGQGDLPSTEPTRMLMKIAKRINDGDQNLKQWFLTTPVQQIFIELKSGKAPEVYKDFQRFIDLYGFRCINELMLESTDLHEDPTFAMEAIISFIKMKNLSVDEIVAREKETSDRAMKIVYESLSGFKLRFYLFILKHARLAVKDREDLRLLRTNIFGISRRIFKSVGHRFHVGTAFRAAIESGQAHAQFAKPHRFAAARGDRSPAGWRRAWQKRRPADPETGAAPAFD